MQYGSKINIFLPSGSKLLTLFGQFNLEIVLFIPKDRYLWYALKKMTSDSYK